ncbi:DUF624 domain-containing protein [Demequina sp. NBRC 110057]|uniref:DUF624 domain-containing protein n=1 Tax=Demequina sp. NBRC 110057 TaxID=1570346 RepID=UPI000A0554E2|nr:DUF624 domain-containing protein [Demequina sp. NBRC 110057]
MTTRRQRRAAARAELDGTGPTRPGWVPHAWPGAHTGFALWGEVLLTGVMVALAALPILTAPAALAAGTRHLTRYLRGEASPWSRYWIDVRQGAIGGAGIGLVTAVIATILVVDIQLAGTGLLPGGGAIAVVGWVGLAALAVLFMAAAGQWDADAGWRNAVARGVSQLRGDLGGAAYLACTAGFVGVVTWMLTPLIVPALGCAALAIVAIPARPRKGEPERLG